PMENTLNSCGAVTNNLLANLNLGYKLLPGLQIKGNLGYTRMQMDQSQLFPAAAFYGPPSSSNRTNDFASTSINTRVLEPQIDYAKKLGQGELDILMGTTFQESVQNYLSQYAYGFSSDALIDDIAAASNVAPIAATNTDYRYNALYGRASY